MLNLNEIRNKGYKLNDVSGIKAEMYCIESSSSYCCILKYTEIYNSIKYLNLKVSNHFTNIGVEELECMIINFILL
ncbi:unnamed protein product [Moneuplotes crassus]|uniref:Uncharacterized protein n=1 Tax=Euplotes crassus TaxID=5936 RepID=A0AAD1X4Y5_EUPCR|nr:unnamed protein product [Moneuplotes crassus]